MDKKLDQIYDTCDFLMKNEYLTSLDLLLIEVCQSINNIDELLGWLTATLPVKSKLRNRDRIYFKIEKLAEEEGYNDDYTERLLQGLG